MIAIETLDRELHRAWSELTAPGALFEIEAIETAGRHFLAYRQAPATVRDIWLGTRDFAGKDYIVYRDERITYDEAHRITRGVAAWLHGQGLRAGDRVAIAMRNYPEWMLIYWACVSAGFVAVGMNAWWAPEEMAAALDDCQPKAIFCDQERLDRLNAASTVLRAPVDRVVAVRASAMGGAIPWQQVIETPGDAPEGPIDPDEDACIFFTSGTTGGPKGVELTHRNCTNGLMNMAFAAQVQSLAIERASGTPIDLGGADSPVALVTTPLFHVTANNCLAYPVTAAGGTLVLMHKWEAGEALRLIERERVITMSGVPTMSRELILHPDFERRDLSSLMTMVGGGAQIPPDLVGKIGDQPFAAKPSTGFGMTELSGIATANTADFLLARPESCGRAMPICEIRLVDDEGREVASGEIGELCIRGANVAKGYFNRPDDTAAAFVDGWVLTGDLARIDDAGCVYIVDRKKDMILRGGENIFCAEVEAALCRHEGVAEVCAFGVEDERLGEEVGVAVHLRDGSTVDAEELRSHVAGLIARHKVPRYIWIFGDALPRNATGKFLRRALRDSLDIADAL